MKKEMLINVLQPEECRIAIVEDGVLEELYVERSSQESYVGNIYKGRIVNIEPSIQAAFVDFGVGRNGFLHVSDVEPAYYRHLEPNQPDPGRRRGRDRHRGGPPPAELEDRAAPPADQEEEPEAPAAPAEGLDGPDTGAREAAEPREEKGGGRGRRRGRGRGRRGRGRGEPKEAAAAAGDEFGLTTS